MFVIVPHFSCLYHAINSRGSFFRRQTSKVDLRTESQIFIIAETHNLVIQMKQKELTSLFMMVSN